MTTWRALIEAAMAMHDESGADVVWTTLSDDALDAEFDHESGGAEGAPFTVWTDDWVYFPATYDGHEWVASVPRHPCDEPTEHIGG